MVADGYGVGVSTVIVHVGVIVGVAVSVYVAVSVKVAVSVSVTVGVAEGVHVTVGVAVSVSVAVRVGSCLPWHRGFANNPSDVPANKSPYTGSIIMPETAPRGAPKPEKFQFVPLSADIIRPSGSAA
jgi:hypothetical protein